MFDQETIAEIIAAGLAENASPSRIAQRIVQLSEDPSWARAQSHPTRRAILKFLRANGSASPSRTARDLKAEVGVISYHYRGLERLGLIELIEKVPRRGAIEHFYRLRDSPRTPSETIRPPGSPPGRPRPVVANPADYVSVAEAAVLAGVTPQTIRTWIKAGRLPSAHVNARWSVVRRDLETLIDER